MLVFHQDSVMRFLLFFVDIDKGNSSQRKNILTWLNFGYMLRIFHIFGNIFGIFWNILVYFVNILGQTLIFYFYMDLLLN